MEVLGEPAGLQEQQWQQLLVKQKQAAAV